MNNKVICALLSCLLLSACGASENDSVKTSEASEDIYKIGIIQYMEHSSLDDATQGFKDELTNLGYKDGENISIEYANASGDSGNAEAIVTKFVNEGVDLIFANATPAAQSAANATTDIPIIITSVTDPAASGLVQSNDKPGVNVSGTSDLADMQTQIQIVTQLLPEVKTVGVMYCSSEQNSIYQAKLAKQTLDSLGLTYKEYTVSDSTLIQSTAQSAIGQIDVMFVPTDNLMAESISTIVATMDEAGIPVIGGFADVADKGGLAAYGVNYYALGQQSAQMAIDVLNGANIADMPIQTLSDDSYELVINQTSASDLGIEVNAELSNKALVVE